MSLYTRLDRLARDLDRVESKVDSVSNRPQTGRTSVEGGSLDFNDSDGNLRAIVGEQDDGGNTINVVSGPTPPTPAGFTVRTDHGSLTVHWDGEFEDGAVAPTDWARWAAYAQQGQFVTPSRETAIGGTDSASGGETTAGVEKGTWTVTVVAWSQAGKMSEMADPVTVEVPGYGDIVMEEIDAAETIIKNGSDILVRAQETLGGKLDSAFGQIDSINEDMSNLDEAVQGAVESANGKNTVNFDTVPPTEADEGVEGDTWFVGRVGREEEQVLARNLWRSSQMSVHRGMTPAASITATPIEGGLELEATSEAPSGAYSLIYTQTPYRVPVEANSSYSWAIPIENTGDKPFPVRINSWIEASGTPSGFASKTLDPGETWIAKMEGMDSSDNGEDIRFSLYYGAGSDKPEVGAKIVMLDGTTLVQSSTAVDPFNGDTADGEGYDDPRYRWVGEPAESESEMYLAPTEDLSQAWNVTAEYRHDGNGWVQVELSHHVLSSMDVGKLVAGSATIKEAVVQKLFTEVVVARMAMADEFIGSNAILDESVTAPKIVASEELWAKLGQFVEIRAEQLHADALNGRVITGTTLQTSGGQGKWSDAGLSIEAPDGESLVNFPTDGSPLSLNADNTTIRSASIDNLDFGDSSLTAGHRLTLETGQLAYPRAPEMRQGWFPYLRFEDPQSSHTWSGLARWGDKWVRLVNEYGNVSTDRLEIYNTDGSLNTSHGLQMNPSHDVAVIGDTAYVLGKDHARPDDEVWFFGIDLHTGQRVSRWQFETQAPGNKIGLSVAPSGNLVSAFVPISNLYLTQWDPNTGAKGKGYSIRWDLKYTHDVQGVAWVGDQIYLTHQQATRVYHVSGDSISRLADDGNESGWAGWYHPNKDGAGMVMHDGQPLVVTQAGELIQGSTFTSDDSATIEAGITFHDGQHETDLSATRSLALSAYNMAAVSIPHRPGLTTRLYYRLAGGDWKQTDADEATKRLWIDKIPNGDNGTPPDENTFPQSSPSEVVSASGGFVVRGNGSGQWGPLQVTADGKAKNLPRVAYGVSVLMNAPSGGGNAYETITFPEGLFTGVPGVTLATHSLASTLINYSVTAVTKDGFTLGINRSNDTDTWMDWIAVEVDYG